MDLNVAMSLRDDLNASTSAMPPYLVEVVNKLPPFMSRALPQRPVIRGPLITVAENARHARFLMVRGCLLPVSSNLK
jgi:hypothetical protein